MPGLTGRRGIAPVRLVVARRIVGIVDRPVAGRIVGYLLRIFLPGRLDGLPRVAFAPVGVRRGLKVLGFFHGTSLWSLGSSQESRRTG